MGKNLWLRAKTKANLKPKLKMKVVWITCNKELGGQMTSAYKIYFRSSHENFQKSPPFKETYVKYLEKNSI